MISTRHLGWTTLALLALVGCDSPSTPPTPTNTTPSDKLPKGENDPVKPMPDEPKKDEPKKDEPKKDDEPKKEGEKSAAVKVQFSPAEMAEIKKLSPEDQVLALAQGKCPVSHNNLGMEVPIKKVIDNTTFFICCSGCEGKVTDKPQEVLAELKK